MDIFENRYFNINRKLFVYMGLWPFEPKTRHIRKFLTLFVLLLVFIPQLISVIVNHLDLDRAILNAVILFILTAVFLKVMVVIVGEGRMIVLYRNIADNWQAITDEQEKKILLEFSEMGRTKTIYYLAFMNISVACVYILPSIPKIMDIISPLQYPRQKIYILESELFLDRETHYALYYFTDAICSVICGIVNASMDTMYFVCIEHCCALYAIIKYRLNELRSMMIDSSTLTETDSYDHVIGIIRLHQVALKFTATVNKAYSMLLLFMLITNMGAIPVDALTVISNLDQPFNCIRFGILFFVFIVHLFMQFWPAQNVLDYNNELVDAAYCNECYTVPVRTRKLLVSFMIRCTRPALLDAGGLMVVNFEIFSKIMRTAISYITVAASFR